MIRLCPPDGQDLLLATVRRAHCVGPRLEVDWRILQDNPKMPYRFYFAGPTFAGPEAVIELTGRGAVVCGQPEDEEEAALFLAHAGVDRLVSDGWAPAGWAKNRYEVMLRQPAPMAMPGLPPGLVEWPAAREVLQVLESRDGPIRPNGNRDGFYADLCARRNRGYAEVYGIKEGIVPVCTAGVYALTEDEAYIACVETTPPAVGKGYASALVYLLCHRFAARRISLMCAPALFGFYAPMGFRPAHKTGVVAIQPPKPPGLEDYYYNNDAAGPLAGGEEDA